MRTNCAIALESGEVFFGRSFGAEGEAFGEAVFNTSMTGYQEILSDPSYKGQIITMTYPEIGNYGCAEENMESLAVHASGFVVRNYSKTASNWRSEESLKDFLVRHQVVACEGIDTRKLTRILRITGAKKSIISTLDLDGKSLVKKAQQSPSIVGRDLILEVTTKQKYEWKENAASKKWRVAVYDFGAKHNILRCLAARNMNLTVFPADAPASELLAIKPDGIFLSNGPGDPSAVPYIVKNVSELAGRLPIFGICFGHQILSQVLGSSTYKLKFGHRGGNQPVRNEADKRIEITSQNHGFAAQTKDISGLMWSHVNLNDNTNEGLDIPEKKIFSVQYHPEASPGPHDSMYLFDRFAKMIAEYAG